MEKGKRFIIKLLVVFISIYCIDGGKSLMHLGNDMQILFTQDHSIDFEMPHQHNLVNFNEVEKWLVGIKFDFMCFDSKSLKFLYYQIIAPQEFSTSIWQPPKFV